MPSRIGKGVGGFTLVELLVVIAIIGILVALLLPAVQSAREAARRTQCKNQVKQIALGCMLHMDSHGFLPTGGWDYDWTADPDRGYGEDQPGGWPYSLLTYIEQGALRDLGKGQTASPADWRAPSIQLHQTPVGVFMCPSRRPARNYKAAWVAVREQGWLANIANNEGVAKCDYAANAGTSRFTDGEQYAAPTSYDQLTKNGLFRNPNLCDGTGNKADTYRCQRGVIHIRSEIKPAQITDGTSNTYLIGEKWLDLNSYEETQPSSSLDFGDNQSLYVGFDWDTIRAAHGEYSAKDPEEYQPAQDAAVGRHNPQYRFGSAHTSGFNMSMCDGSTQFVSYDIDPVVHGNMAERFDGNPASLQ